MIIYVDGKKNEAEKIIKTDKGYKGFNGENCVFIVSLDKNVTGEYIEEITPEERIEVLENAILEFVLGKGVI